MLIIHNIFDRLVLYLKSMEDSHIEIDWSTTREYLTVLMNMFTCSYWLVFCLFVYQKINSYIAL